MNVDAGVARSNEPRCGMKKGLGSRINGAPMRAGQIFLNATGHLVRAWWKGRSRSVRNRDVSPAASMDGFTAVRERPFHQARTRDRANRSGM
jgi:hypothetical protein